ncbi:MAG TPA: hypothetical protein VKB12_08480 [Pyrinomonadaceae bacterium]|nr:hypothetical protein [Pyrinomonadaceae bacterium]
MPVVISDFEVVVEPPAAPPVAAADGPTETESVVLTPWEMELLLERQSERDARVRAH